MIYRTDKLQIICPTDERFNQTPVTTIQITRIKKAFLCVFLDIHGTP